MNNIVKQYFGIAIGIVLIFGLLSCTKLNLALDIASDDELNMSYEQAISHYENHEYEKAKEAGERYVKRSRAIYGPDSKTTIIGETFLCSIARLLGDERYVYRTYSRLLDMYKRNPNIFKGLSVGYEDILHNLADAAEQMGDLKNAERLAQEFLSFRKQKYGTESKEYGEALEWYAMHKNHLGDIESAESYLFRALEKCDDDCFFPLNNLAILYLDLKDYDKSLHYLNKAEEIYNNSKEENDSRLRYYRKHILYKTKARLYIAMKKYKEAELLLLPVLNEQIAEYGENAPIIAWTHHILAAVYYYIDIQQSLYYGKKCLQKQIEFYGDRDLNVALFYSNYGAALLSNNQLKEASKYLQAAMSIFPDHGKAADRWKTTTLENLGILEDLLGRPTSCLNYLQEAQEISNIQISNILSMTSEKQKLAFISSLQEGFDKYFNISYKYKKYTNESLVPLYSNWIKRKGLVLDAQKQYNEAKYKTSDPNLKKMYTELNDVRSQLSNLMFVSTTSESAADFNSQVSRLEKTKQELEKQISAINKNYSIEKFNSDVSNLDLSKVLESNAVLIDFARIQTYKFKGGDVWLPAHYYAFILYPGNGDLTIVDLGEADPIDSDIRVLFDLFKKIDPSEQGSSQAVMNQCAKLHKSVFKPLVSKLRNAKTLYISPDGALNMLPFEILLSGSGQYLIEKHTINYLSSSKELLSFSADNLPSGEDVVIGAPDFNITLEGAPETEGSSKSRGLSLLYFTSLDGAEEETKKIAQVIQAKSENIFLGSDAAESVLYNLNGPKRLHLATHGFYLSDQQLPSHKNYHVSNADVPQERQSISLSSYENPLIRSGFALAGANISLHSDEARIGAGIVTAEKVLSVNLDGTDMVVLSACESAQGDIVSGEGVYGLRRAFFQAGTKSMVMSAWSVPDDETKELMVHFYENLEAGGMSRSESLRSAILREISIVKERYGHTNPYYWGAFMFIGAP